MPCAVVADGSGKAMGTRDCFPARVDPYDEGVCHGKSNWVLRTEDLPDGACYSVATREGYRVLFADQEISLAQAVRYLEPGGFWNWNESGVCRTR